MQPVVILLRVIITMSKEIQDVCYAALQILTSTKYDQSCYHTLAISFLVCVCDLTLNKIKKLNVNNYSRENTVHIALLDSEPR